MICFDKYQRTVHCIKQKIAQHQLIVLHIALLVMIVAADQWSKHVVKDFLITRDFRSLNVTSFLSIVWQQNTGIAFGMFHNANATQIQHIILLCMNIAAIALLCYMLKFQDKGKKLIITLSLVPILGGAAGNMLDRVLHDHIFDFIYFHYRGYSFPAFNLADAFISLGAGSWILIDLVIYRSSKKSK